ncbi:hypothetical protein [Thioclava sp. SK-1]|uniref:hypothetical protein n=1 Tax=Thioclava sp. SK-1 TaxID=1889770 RepID=UPI000824DEBE|nr:hypothetical protein [Thioclava sp. SK-1]
MLAKRKTKQWVIISMHGNISTYAGNYWCLYEKFDIQRDVPKMAAYSLCKKRMADFTPEHVVFNGTAP